MATKTAPRPTRRRRDAPPRAATRPPDRPPAATDSGAFLSQVAHHLRAPVAVSRTMLSLLSEGYVGKMDTQQAELVRRVEARMACMQALVDDLIDLASVRTGPAVAAGPTALDAVVRNVCVRLEPGAREKGIGLEVAGPAEPAMVAVAPGPLDLAVAHLVRNAITYSARGTVRVSVETDRRFARLLVADEGIGIPADDRASVFDEFYRAANARAHEELGTGLGLTIVRDVVCRAGAAIEIDSAVGQGTAIAVRLPLGSAAPGTTTRRRVRGEEARRRWPRS